MNYHLLDVSQLEQISQLEKSPDQSDSEIDHQQHLDNHRSAKDFRRALRGRRSVYPKHALTDEEEEDNNNDEQNTEAGEETGQTSSAIKNNNKINKNSPSLGATRPAGAARLHGADGVQASLSLDTAHNRSDYAPAARPISAKETRAKHRQAGTKSIPTNFSTTSSGAAGNGTTSAAVGSGEQASCAATAGAGAGAASSSFTAPGAGSTTTPELESSSSLDSNGLFDDWEIITAASVSENDRAWLAKKSKAAWQASTRDAQIHADGPLLLAFS